MFGQRSLILLWGIAADGPMAAVRTALARLDTPVVFLDQEAVLQTGIELQVDREISGCIHWDSGVVDLESIGAVYLRPHDIRKTCAALGHSAAQHTSTLRALAFEDALLGWIESTPAFVISRPSAMSSNNSKPFQMDAIRACGFDVPDTLVTTDATAVLEFWERHRVVVY